MTWGASCVTWGAGCVTWGAGCVSWSLLVDLGTNFEVCLYPVILAV